MGTLFFNGSALSNLALGAAALMSFGAAQNAWAASDPKAYEIASKVERTYQGYADETVDAVMTIKSGNGSKSSREFEMVTLEVVKGGDLRAVTFSAPTELDGFVSLSHTRFKTPDLQWVYLPEFDRVRRLSSRDKSGSFAGSEFSFEDIVRWELDRYDYEYVGPTKCKAKAGCEVLVNIPRYPHSGYARLVEVIDMSILKPIQITYYDKNNRELKRLEMTGYKKVGNGQMRPMNARMTNLRTGAVTDIKWSNYRFGKGFNQTNFKDTRIRDWAK
ncbi:outer membrane lipoprotein-sorting protein [Amylibacter sp. SFDW26]|uniref:outer membrane lipoprotein-sorting protein n=1 Tax=Amylibacter sp. SFDW26 TaxID=2652722 RepID=UPI0012625EDF|nr:outer membrane lipoprotein-sorting protein [Amylibacter sp. SFDW26]KAB7613765.1 outer membrane lipoprotein-sorting protein [Amylibacter sp. SFDW26]